eukprot:TRINITY_DN8973_c0_g1_i4.p1 TRINITY_DN8973_c0_g1~~TRINITY_DN8973_c0_g1_i4.p1  ORF type:complete len:362 (+),score=104.02 TRINITY_DN8973_c0_g1_i4:447-1532(+)
MSRLFTMDTNRKQLGKEIEAVVSTQSTFFFFFFFFFPCQGNERLNLAFAASLFDKYPGLKLQPGNPFHQLKFNQAQLMLQQENLQNQQQLLPVDQGYIHLAEDAKRHQEELHRRELLQEETKQTQKAMEEALQEDERRRRAWDEYFKQQEAQKQEEARRLAWEEYNKSPKEYHQQQQQPSHQHQHQQPLQQPLQQQPHHLSPVQKTYQQPPLQTPSNTVQVVTQVSTPGVAGKWPIHQLILSVVRGRRLLKKDKIITKGDPYVTAIHNGYKQKTAWQRNTQDPIFNHDFTFRNVSQEDTILLQVLNKEISLFQDDFMGEVRLTSKDFIHGNESWYTLGSREHKFDKVNGDILVRFTLIYDS